MRNLLVITLIALIFCTLIVSGCAKPPGEVTTIHWAISKNLANVCTDFINFYEIKNPNIKIELILLPDNSIIQRNSFIKYLSSEDKIIDIYTLNNEWTAEFAAADWIEPIDDYLLHYDKSAVFPAALANCKYNDRTYALPWTVDASVLYYRKDWLDKYNLLPGQYLNLFPEVIKQVQDKTKVTGFLFSIKGPGAIVRTFYELSSAYGAKIVTPTYRVRLDSEQCALALSFLTDLIHNYRITPTEVLNLTAADEAALFAQEQAVSILGKCSTWKTLANMSDSTNKIAISPLPNMPQGFSGALLYSRNLAISKYSNCKNVTADFIKFLVSFNTQRHLAIKFTLFPAMAAVYVDQKVVDISPHYRAFMLIFENSRPAPTTPFYTQISDLLQYELYQALTLKKSGRQALEDAQKNISSLYNKYRQ